MLPRRWGMGEGDLCDHFSLLSVIQSHWGWWCSPWWEITAELPELCYSLSRWIRLAEKWRYPELAVVCDALRWIWGRLGTPWGWWWVRAVRGVCGRHHGLGSGIAPQGDGWRWQWWQLSPECAVRDTHWQNQLCSDSMLANSDSQCNLWNLQPLPSPSRSRFMWHWWHSLVLSCQKLGGSPHLSLFIFHRRCWAWQAPNLK